MKTLLLVFAPLSRGIDKNFKLNILLSLRELLAFSRYVIILVFYPFGNKVFLTAYYVQTNEDPLPIFVGVVSAWFFLFSSYLILLLKY